MKLDLEELNKKYELRKKNHPPEEDWLFDIDADDKICAACKCRFTIHSLEIKKDQKEKLFSILKRLI